MTEPGLPTAKRRSRLGLFAPFVLLALVAAGWSAAWFVIRGRTAEAVDAWLDRERQAGRRWSCPDRSVGGYPFRIEVVCPSLAFERPDLTGSIGRVVAVAQVYDPRHVIAEIEGPMRAGDGRVIVEGAWRALRTSVRTNKDGFERASLAIDGPSFRVTGLPAELIVSGRRFESHARPNPSRNAGEAAYDWSARADGTRLPLLDEFVGGGDPADIGLDLTITQAREGPLRSVADLAERWREAGGKLDIANLSLAKGARRVEARGEARLDELHRPAARIEASAAGLEDLIAPLLGGGRAGGVGGLLGALAAQALAPRRPAAEEAEAGKPALRPLPPVRLEGGRLYLGPIAVPGVRLAPLY